MLQDLKDFFIECMLFQNPKEGSIVPNWTLGIYAWLNVFVIIYPFLKLIF